MTYSAKQLADVKGIGAVTAEKLTNIGLRTAEDFALYYPRKYDDYSVVSDIAHIQPGLVAIKARLTDIKQRRVRRSLHITEAAAEDATGRLKVVWFNQPYRAAAIKPGETYYLQGEFGLKSQRLQMLNPSAELAGEVSTGEGDKIIATYRETAGIQSATFRKISAGLRDYFEELPETLPSWLVKKYELMPYGQAIRAIHLPNSSAELALAQERLGFEELLVVMMAAQANREQTLSLVAPVSTFYPKIAQDFVKALPFDLTDSQRKVIWQIYKDMAGDSAHELQAGAVPPASSHSDAMQESGEQRSEAYEVYGERVAQPLPQQRAESTGRVLGSAQKQVSAVRSSRPMNRLVEGDVGSGKTVVAAMAALMAAHNGLQVAVIAPTELLAQQHAETFAKVFAHSPLKSRIAVLTGSVKPKAKQQLKDHIKSGDISIVIGTHALLQQSVDWHNIGLVVIDEQHRFGVEQRQKLHTKAGHMPHVLCLTATPIPRSLALTVYGELDISILDQAPSNRAGVETTLVSPNSTAQMYAAVEQQLQAGRQAYIVCPLILESEVLQTASAEQTYEQLRKKELKKWRVGLLHGRLKPDEKDDIMRKFVAHELDVLVATTVIEVGVDVANAAAMVILGADRFGLAQLHQLRGRVGRAEHKGQCYLVMSDSKAPPRRMRALATTTDGFELAELDLKLRGPGAIYGKRQSGALDLRLVQLSDTKLIAKTRSAVQETRAKGENLLKYKQIAARIKRAESLTYLN